MAKKSSNIIIVGKYCEGCKYLKCERKSKVVTCKLKNKRYYYGQYIACEDKTNK